MNKYILSFFLLLSVNTIACGNSTTNNGTSSNNGTANNNGTLENNETKNNGTTRNNETLENNRTTSGATNNTTSNTNNASTSNTNNESNSTLGGKCGTDSDCGSETTDQCISSSSYFPGGYCISQTCSDPGAEEYPVGVAYQNDEECGEGNVCIIRVNSVRSKGKCWAGCKKYSDCRVGYECLAGIGLDGDKKFALRCESDYGGCTSDADCGGYHCLAESNRGVGVCTFDCGNFNSDGVDFCVATGGTCKDVGLFYEVCVLPE